MPSRAEQSIHEVDFCARVAADAEQIFASNRDFFPFVEVRVEGFGAGEARRTRKDLRFYEPSNKLALCGEVKLPGTSEGSSPFESTVVADAYRKAEDANVQYFFTWNVNEFVLWDRGRWDVPLLERRIKVWRLELNLSSPEEVVRPETLDHIRTKFLPDLLRDLADIYTGRRRDWELPPDDIFIRSLESHLDWPVLLLRQYLVRQSEVNRSFGHRIEIWLSSQDRPFIRSDPREWRDTLDAAARSLAYVWANRLIFYKALRARFPQLPRLELKSAVATASLAQAAFDALFQRAVEVSGDYEPLLFPGTHDWATQLVFEPEGALDAWRGLLRGIESIDFRQVRSDVVGRIFQKLISPEERHRFGQHFTGDDAVDLINAFCIRNADDRVLDPACGSGSFLVRAYYRKQRLDPRRSHAELLSDLFGCDIALYPAHLATLNLAAREINDEANYPRIARRDFFDIEPEKAFVELPDGHGGHVPVALPALDAVVGNPPYVRQEKIERADKPKLLRLANEAWRDLMLSGRSDLHCYFWPVATKLLKDDGYFGFLTSSSWLDVEYGFALQGWILSHFRLVAVLESADEPWFTDARVKTCITILQRCDDEQKRMENLVRFVKFRRPLADVIAVPSGDNEGRRQRAAEKLARRIEAARTEQHDDDMRLILKPQRELWEEGVSGVDNLQDHGANGEDDADEDEAEDHAEIENGGHLSRGHADTGYRGGKWGRYVRAPDFYFRVMRQLHGRFRRLGELVEVRRGITSGCDAFFMPRDITKQTLAECKTEAEFRGKTGARRREVESGRLRIIRDGVGVVHPIESEFIAPELHSLMNVDRPIVRRADLDRVVLLVDKSLSQLKGTWAYRYIQYGKTSTFQSKKSGAKPVPERSTVAARDPWYDLTNLVRPGFAFWPMAQQYRHIVPANPHALICNHNLFDLSSKRLNRREKLALVAVLNSTLVGLFKTFYGRFAGTEGNLKTEVVDVNLIEVPDVRGIRNGVCKKLAGALRAMQRREVGRLVEEQLMDCHSPERARRIASGPIVLAEELRQRDRRDLDDAVFELLGVSDVEQRAQLVDALYEETALHFRAIRVIEIQKMRQRAATAERRLNVGDLAADCWDAAGLDDATPLKEWIERQPSAKQAVNIPEEHPASLSPSPMFDPNTVYFGRAPRKTRDYASRGQAELVHRLAQLGISGPIRLPSDLEPAMKLLDAVEHRLRKANDVFEAVAENRVGSNLGLREQIVELLVRWFIQGKEPTAEPSVTPG